MHISLIIGFYKQLNNLSILIESLKNQSYTTFEVIIAEDDDSVETINYLNNVKKEIAFTIKHVSQPNLGFRKNKILNDAIKISSGEFIVFIDGDCVPHKHFLKQYARIFKPFTILYGRRVMLSEKHTKDLYNTKDLTRLNLFRLLLNRCELIESGLYWPFYSIRRNKLKRIIVGSNWGIDRNSLLNVNGFDEDYVRAGVGEDVDIEWRLLKLGTKSKCVKFKCIQYHLYHKPNYSPEDTYYNYSLLEDKKKSGWIKCKNGIVKL